MSTIADENAVAPAHQTPMSAQKKTMASPAHPSMSKPKTTPSQLMSSKKNGNKKKAVLTPMANISMAMKGSGRRVSKSNVNKQKNLESMQRKNRSLEEEKARLQERIEQLEAENKMIISDREQEMAASEQTEKDLRQEILQLKEEMNQSATIHAKNEEDENKRIRALRKERNELRKDNATLQKKLDKTEEYLRISKELSCTLHKKQQALSEETEEKGKKLLEALGQLKTMSNETETLMKEIDVEKRKVADTTQQITAKDQTLNSLELQLVTIATLYVKLSKLAMGESANTTLDVQALLEQFKQENLPHKQWSDKIWLEYEKQAPAATKKRKQRRVVRPEPAKRSTYSSINAPLYNVVEDQF